MPFGRCRECVFFKRVWTATPDGHCHRYAPRPESNALIFWPTVQADDGCGDFELIEAGAEIADTDPKLAVRTVA